VSVVLVVVIVGVVIAAIAGAASRGQKPATPAVPSERETVSWGPSAPEPAADSPGEPVTEPPTDDRGLVTGLRSGVLLVVTVVLLGALAAGCIGGALYLGAHVLQRAVR
jgi:hypothetical protein